MIISRAVAFSRAVVASQSCTDSLASSVTHPASAGVIPAMRRAAAATAARASSVVAGVPGTRG